MTTDPFRRICGGTGTPKKTGEWTPIVPVPDDAPPPPTQHPTLGQPAATYTYRAADGQVNGYVLRFDHAGGKEFRPLTYCQHPGGVLRNWRWTTWRKPRPLFNLDHIDKRRAAPVLIVEGEKACGAAQQLAPGYVCITSPGGSKAAAQADWTPLNGREVVIWPDNDDPGWQYAATVAKQAGAIGALRVLVIQPPAGVPPSWDAADALAEGYDEAQAWRLIAGAAKQPKPHQRPGKSADDADAEDGGRRRGRPPQRDQLMVYMEGIELWHDGAGKAYATFPVGQHRENAAIGSSQFRRWLTLQYFDDHGAAPGDNAIKECLNTAEAIAVIRGKRHTANVRVAEQDGRIYHDLCNDDWQAVEITRHGWDIVDRVPVKFVRRDGMLPLPTPERVTEQQSGVVELRCFFGNLNQAHFALVAAWLMSCFRDTGAYPVLMIHASQAGTGKTFLTKLLMGLIDPRFDGPQSAPDDGVNLIAFAKQTHVIGFDNVSYVPNWFSDALCRLSTGDSLSRVKKYTDDEIVNHKAKRPVIMNGIPQLGEAGDLASRAFSVSLTPMVDCPPETELLARWQDAQPRILAGLYDGVSCALRNVDGVKLPGTTRLIGALKWAAAAEPNLGFDDGEIFEAYQHSERETIQASFEADVVAISVRNFILGQPGRQWEGTREALLTELNNKAPENYKKLKSWPTTPHALSTRLTRAIGVLRPQGVIVERRHTRDCWLITIVVRDQV
jgi:hypothetical protein